MTTSVQADHWQRPLRFPELERGTVHVWHVPLDPLPGLERLEAILSPDEVSRAGRFRFEKHRRRFAGARAALRQILGRYCGQPAASLVFKTNEYGKPGLNGVDELQFNASHSGDQALVAVTRGMEVGVDLEVIRTDAAGEEIAERFFSPVEVAALRSLPEQQRVLGFFNCWTRKEAFIKGLGKGLSHPLDSFDVSLIPSAPAALLATYDDPAEAACWTLHALTPPGGAAAAVAVRGRDLVFHLFAFDGGTT